MWVDICYVLMFLMSWKLRMVVCVLIRLGCCVVVWIYLGVFFYDVL